MITRRAGGPVGATTGAASTVASGFNSTVETGAATGVAATRGGGGGVETAGATGAAGAVATSTGAVAGTVGFATEAATTTGAAAATTGRSCVGGVVVAAPPRGRAIPGPSGGLLAIAGAGAGTTIFACWRGSGTIRRGAGGAP